MDFQDVLLPFSVYPGRAATHPYSLTTWSPELPGVGFAGIEDAGGARLGLRRGGRSRAFQARCGGTDEKCQAIHLSTLIDIHYVDMDTLVRLPGPQIQFLDSYCDVLP